MEKKKQIGIFVLILAVAMIGSVALIINDNPVKKESSNSTSFQTSKTLGNDDQSEIYVHVCGQVKKPGLYVFSSEPRVAQAIKKAGGFTKKADKDQVNQAELVKDGTRLEIPKKEKKSSSNSEDESQSSLVNLNKASKEQLMTLSGIGEAKAMMILAYREEKGRFQKIEDIMNISGIKEGVFDRIKGQITV